MRDNHPWLWRSIVTGFAVPGRPRAPLKSGFRLSGDVSGRLCGRSLTRLKYAAFRDDAFVSAS